MSERTVQLLAEELEKNGFDVNIDRDIPYRLSAYGSVYSVDDVEHIGDIYRLFQTIVQAYIGGDIDILWTDRNELELGVTT